MDDVLQARKKVYKSQFCKQTQCKLSIVSLLWYRLTPNPIIMSTRCRITKRLYVVIKNKPIVCKFSFGFVLFNRCWKLIELFGFDIQCLCLLHALHAAVENDSVFLLIYRCVDLRGRLRMSNPLPDLTHPPLFEQPHLAAPGKCWH